jgi:hypothetical protein
MFDALQQAHPDDLKVIQRYIAWVKLRRRIHDTFYQKPVHWVDTTRRIQSAHWV